VFTTFGPADTGPVRPLPKEQGAPSRHQRDRAAGAGGLAQSSIGCEQLATEGFCQRNI
jgi:hypothetical protein